MNIYGSQEPTLAGQIMLTKLVVVRDTDRVYDAAKRLLRKGVSSAPVVNEEGVLCGVFTELHALRALLLVVMDRHPAMVVSDVMETDFRCVSMTDHLLNLAQKIVLDRLESVLVVDDEGMLRGIITRQDLLHAAAKVFSKAPSKQAAVLYLSALGRASRSIL